MAPDTRIISHLIRDVSILDAYLDLIDDGSAMVSLCYFA